MQETTKQYQGYSVGRRACSKRDIHVTGRYFRFVAILKIIVSSENYINVGLLAYCGNWVTSKGGLCFGDTWHNLDVEGVRVR